MASRGRYARGEARRAAILQAATRMIGEDGYRQTSVRAIARAIGVDPANVLYYFESREKLLEEIIRQWDTDYQRLAEEAGYEHFDIEWWAQGTAQNVRLPGLVRLMVIFAAESAEPEHPSHDFMKSRSEHLHAEIIADLERRQERGVLSSTADLDFLAESFIALADGLELRWLNNRDLPFPELLTRGVAALLASAAVASPSTLQWG